MARCPACSRATRFYGVIARPNVWLRWDICDTCEAFFVTDQSGAYLWGRRAIDRNGYPWLPPRAWFSPGQAVVRDGADRSIAAEPSSSPAALSELLTIIEAARTSAMRS